MIDAGKLALVLETVSNLSIIYDQVRYNKFGEEGGDYSRRSKTNYPAALKQISGLFTDVGKSRKSCSNYSLRLSQSACVE